MKPISGSSCPLDRASALVGKPGVISVARGWSSGQKINRVVSKPQRAGTYVSTLAPASDTASEVTMPQGKAPVCTKKISIRRHWNLLSANKGAVLFPLAIHRRMKERDEKPGEEGS